MKEYKPFKSGKVRELYDLGDSLIMVCTDRISAFDNILENPIPKKGEVLNKMSKFWFDLTEDILPNHMITMQRKMLMQICTLMKSKAASMDTAETPAKARTTTPSV